MKKIIATSVLGIGIVFGSFISSYATTMDDTLVYVNQGVSGRRILESVQSIEKRQKIRFDKAVKKNDLKLAQRIINETFQVTKRTTPFKIPPKKTNISNFTHSEYFNSTAYCLTGTTAWGTQTTNRRTISVDPNRIKLGTKVYIQFYGQFSYMSGWYVAEDTGGVIKGNIVDIYIFGYQNCIDYGIRQVKISW